MITLRWGISRIKGVRTKFIKQAAKLALLYSSIDYDSVEVSIYLTDDQTIRELNKKYRNIDKPTDVLSFAYDPPIQTSPKKPLLIGEIVISLTTAKKQAKEYKRTLEDEVVLLVVHGVLHLGGYEDETEEGYNLMLKKGEEIWSEIKEVFYNPSLMPIKDSKKLSD